MKFFDCFAGIGGFRLGLEQAGHTCIGFAEMDKYARKSYKAIFDTKGEVEFHDITQVSDESIRQQLRGKFDLLCGGFPCQAFSIAGNRRGFDDTRGTLFFELARIAAICKPTYWLCENVPGLLTHDKGRTFQKILQTMDELGYDAEWQCLNSQYFGVPQNRNRLYLIGHLRGRSTRNIFPLRTDHQKITQQFTPTTNTLVARYGEAQTTGSYIIENQQTPLKVGNTNPSQKGINGNVYDSNHLAPTLTTNKGEGPKILQRKHGYNQGGCFNQAPTLTKSSYHENNLLKTTDSYNKTLKDQTIRLRKLTPRECWRLQAFPEWAFDKAQAVNSNSQLYKQAGNSVTVTIIETLGKELSKYK